jgi:hypothetical protein
LLLADFLLDTISSSLQFHNINVMELGAGTGKVETVLRITWLILASSSGACKYHLVGFFFLLSLHKVLDITNDEECLLQTS